jgi:hypothetical protein
MVKRKKETKPLKKKQHSGGAVPDKHGRHQPRNKMHPDGIKFIRDFINELPANNTASRFEFQCTKQTLQ